MQKILETANEKWKRYTCQLHSKDSDGIRPLGSGVFIKIEKVHFLVTAGHVLEDIIANGELVWIRVGPDDYMSITGKMVSSILDNEIDLAYIVLNQNTLPHLKINYFFLPLTNVRVHDELKFSEIYCVHGYPEKSHMIVNKKKEPVSQSFILDPCKKKVYEYYKFNPEIFYMLEMKGKGVNMVSNEKGKVGTEFYGMSGCGLWHFYYFNENGTIKTGADLIGIMTKFKNSKYFSLVGIKIIHLINAICDFEKIPLRLRK